SRRGAILVETERREGPKFVESAPLVPELLTRPHVLRRGVGFGNYVFFFETDLRERRRLERKRLRRRIPLARHITFGDGTLLDAEDGLSVRAVEDEHITSLADGSEGRNGPSVLYDIDKAWCGRHVRIPDVVMHRLKVPFVFARLCVDRNDGVREEIVSRPVAAPVVRCRTGHRHVHDAPLLVDGHGETPDVGARASLPSVAPCVVPQLSRLWLRVKIPELLPRTRVICAGISGRANGNLVDVCPDQHHVLENRRRRVLGTDGIAYP